MVSVLYSCSYTLEVTKENDLLRTHSCDAFCKNDEFDIYLRGFFVSFLSAKFLFFRAKKMFVSKIVKGQKYRSTDTVRENYFIADLKRKNFLKGKIYLGHCRGHDTINILFVFEGFYETDIRLLSKNYGIQ